MRRGLEIWRVWGESVLVRGVPVLIACSVETLGGSPGRPRPGLAPRWRTGSRSSRSCLPRCGPGGRPRPRHASSPWWRYGRRACPPRPTAVKVRFTASGLAGTAFGAGAFAGAAGKAVATLLRARVVVLVLVLILILLLWPGLGASSSCKFSVGVRGSVAESGDIGV